MPPIRHLLVATCVAFALPAAMVAQSPSTASGTKPKPKKETQGQLQAQAKVSLTDATAIAAKEVPAGKITEHELEREDGRLIYSFDIKVAGKSGTEEVNVDALTGALVAHTHESPESEAKEKAKEKKVTSTGKTGGI